MNYSVVILSKNDKNLTACMQAILENEPALPVEDIIVVDDGLKGEYPCTVIKGEEPFIFARNANAGIFKAHQDVILLNDDAILQTFQGFSKLAEVARQYDDMGMCSAGINGFVNNPKQRPVESGRMRYSNDASIAFVCVFIPWLVFRSVGPLDEQYVGYGFEDTDYWMRCVQIGLRIGIWDGCVVDHSGKLKSTFRGVAGQPQLFRQNQILFQNKWGKL